MVPFSSRFCLQKRDQRCESQIFQIWEKDYFINLGKSERILCFEKSLHYLVDALGKKIVFVLKQNGSFKTIIGK